jgi:hypothetical protein
LIGQHEGIHRPDLNADTGSDIGNNEAFAEAFACGLARFVTFLGASKLDATAIGQPLLRQCVGSL